MQKINLLLLMLTFPALTSCHKEEIATREYPRINTLDVSGISATDAVFNAEVISGDASLITEYGFIVSAYSPLLELDNSVLVFPGVANGKRFSGNATGLISQKLYYMRSYVRTDNFLVYGKVLSFKTL
jgi:hypothetical protein